jgi:hypothetical protein
VVRGTGQPSRIKSVVTGYVEQGQGQNLSALKNGFDVPQATHDGFVVAHVKSITVISPEKNLQIECTAMACREQHCVSLS